MANEIVIILSGFLFLAILILFLAVLPLLGYVMGTGDFDSKSVLLKINRNPNKFKLSVGIALVHDICVIILAVFLFLAFSSYNIFLGIILLIFRTGEGLVLIYTEKIYWKLLNIAEKYSNVSNTEKTEQVNSGRSILEIRNSKFSFGMILWSIGTLSFSIIIVTSTVVPSLIGWLGIIASIAVGFHDGIILTKQTEYKILMAGSLAAIVFEIIIGVWLIFYGFNVF